MNRLRLIISCLFASLALSACDSGNAPEWASPQIRVSLRDADVDFAAKASTILNVALDIKSRGGGDYSPEPVTVDNASQTQVAFDVTIPADSLYSFVVRFTSGSTLVAEGGTIEEVSLATSVVDIAVLTRSTSRPSLAFVPSNVNTSTGGGTLEITLRYYGAGTPVTGIAALFDVTGSTPRAFTLEGADLSFAEGSEFNAAWQFAGSVQGVRDIGTLRLARNQTANFCLEAGTDAVRVVDESGTVSTAALLGTCIHVTP